MQPKPHTWGGNKDRLPRLPKTNSWNLECVPIPQVSQEINSSEWSICRRVQSIIPVPQNHLHAISQIRPLE